MAVCEIWDVRGRLDHPIDYAENPEKTANPKYTEADLQAMVDVMEYATNKNKTEQRFFVTGVNCDPTTARDEMMITKAGWNDTSEIVCYHGFQSFKHGEVTPEQAHEVGVKLAERMWGDRFQVIVATHLNTDCLHNHFVVNSVSFADGMHYHSWCSEMPICLARMARSLCACDSRIIKSVLSRMFSISRLASRSFTFCVRAEGTQPCLRSIFQTVTK